MLNPQTIPRATGAQIAKLERYAAMLEWSESDALLAAALEGAAPERGDDPESSEITRFAQLTEAQADTLIEWLWEVITDAGDMPIQRARARA
jgi:hypothetical protein